MQPSKNAAKFEKRPLAANWLDLESGDEDKNAEKAIAALRSHSVPESLIEAALTSGALPKFDSEGTSYVLLLRVFDEAAGQLAENTRALTRKLAIIVLPGQVFTVHRFPTPEIPKIFTPKGGVLGNPAETIAPEIILSHMLERTIATYADAIRLSEAATDKIEASIFKPSRGKAFRLRDAYFLKRRLSTQKKMLELNRDAFEAVVLLHPVLTKSLIRRKFARAIATADALIEELNHLLQLQVALVSQKTNEGMRILTVFSAFFLPLSFIAGVYGMNFERMPELHHPYGYAATLALMASVAFVIYVWFRKNGWIGKND